MSGEIDSPKVRLEMTSRPEAARLVRSMSSAAGEALGLNPELMSDINTAVSEACNNVIQHAYSGEPGPFSVDLAAMAAGLAVQVRDYGRGIREAAADHDGLKVGLALFERRRRPRRVHTGADGGTEVRLCFRGAAGARTTSGQASSEADDPPQVWQARVRPACRATSS